jgi:uncharacterized membrane protein
MPSDLGTTSSGIDANVAAALAYAGFWFTGLAFVLFEQENKFVRFHALQSIIVSVALTLAFIVALSIPLLGWIVAFLIIIPGWILLWLILMYKAYQGERFKVPGAGDMAEQRL